LAEPLEIAGQQIGGLTVVELTAFTFAVGGRSHDPQPERDLAATTTPVHPRQVFVADLATLAPVDDLGLLPGPGVILAHLFGGERWGVIEAAGILGSMKTQAGILASATDQLGAVARGPQVGTVTKAAIRSQHQDLVLATGGVELLPQLTHGLHKALREVIELGHLFVFFPGFLAGFAGGFLDP